jgi:hypothetical protein
MIWYLIKNGYNIENKDQLLVTVGLSPPDPCSSRSRLFMVTLTGKSC